MKMQLAADLSALAAVAHEEGVTFVLSVYSGEYRFDWRGDSRVWVYSRDHSHDREHEALGVAVAEQNELKPGFVNTAMIEKVGMDFVKSTRQ